MAWKRLKNLVFAVIVALAIVGCARLSAAIVTTTYEFLPDQSTVVLYGRGGPYPYPIEGQFQLTVDFDAGIALFEQVDATISEKIYFFDYYGEEPIYTDSLNVLFHMTEMVSTNVTDTVIDFVFEKNIPTFPGADVYLTVTFLNDSIHLTGYFNEPIHDGGYIHLDAIAVPEPTTILMIALGGLIVKKRFFKQ